MSLCPLTKEVLSVSLWLKYPENLLCVGSWKILYDIISTSDAFDCITEGFLRTNILLKGWRYYRILLHFIENPFWSCILFFFASLPWCKCLRAGEKPDFLTWKTAPLLISGWNDHFDQQMINSADLCTASVPCVCTLNKYILKKLWWVLILIRVEAHRAYTQCYWFGWMHKAHWPISFQSVEDSPEQRYNTELINASLSPAIIVFLAIIVVFIT